MWRTVLRIADLPRKNGRLTCVIFIFESYVRARMCAMFSRRSVNSHDLGTDVIRNCRIGRWFHLILRDFNAVLCITHQKIMLLLSPRRQLCSSKRSLWRRSASRLSFHEAIGLHAALKPFRNLLFFLFFLSRSFRIPLPSGLLATNHCIERV